MPSSRRRWTLTRTFAVVSTVTLLLLGASLILVTVRVIERQARQDGTESAEAVQAYATAVVPEQAFALGVLDPSTDAAVQAAITGFGDRLHRLRLWTVDGALLFDSSRDETGFPDAVRLDAATRLGQTDARVVTEVDGAAMGATRTTVLDVYLPVQGAAGTIGAAQVTLDYDEPTRAIADATRTVVLVVAGGIVLTWLMLFRTVRNASRRLQVSARDNARLALVDSLTGLPNRRMLTEQLRRVLDEAHRDGTHVGLVFLDIDRFKDINDSLGHDYGDTLLQQVAERLHGAFRSQDVVARLGGDEFAVVLPDVGSVDVARRLAERVRSLFATPFMLEDLQLHVDTSVGLACLPDHADDASSLMRRADVAMYTAKTHHLSVAVYDPDDDQSSPARLVLLGDLHRALADHVELAMYYQPKIDLASGRTIGLEALMRWHHPTRGLVPPDVFVPLAEQSGLIHDLTRVALTGTIRQLARWQADGVDVPVAVNLSAHDLTSPGVADLVEELLAEHGVPARLLQVEITETALVADPVRALATLEQLAAAGVSIAIDDFGIGNTSISQLRTLPVDRLKIDRLFIADLGTHGDEGSRDVVRAMVELAHSFGMRVVAEGVEVPETAMTLRGLGVDEAQGFLYSPAVPAADLPVEAVGWPTAAPTPATSATRTGAPGSATPNGTDAAQPLKSDEDRPDDGTGSRARRTPRARS